MKIKHQTNLFIQLKLIILVIFSIIPNYFLNPIAKASISPTLSSFKILPDQIEPSDPNTYPDQTGNLNMYNPNNTALIMVTPIDDGGPFPAPVPNSTIELSISPNDGKVKTFEIPCSTIRTITNTTQSNTTINNITYSGCFIAYYTDDISDKFQSNSINEYTITADINNTTTLQAESTLKIKPIANIGIGNYIFRQDDNNEIDASNLMPVNTPLYNISKNENFRLRVSLTRKLSILNTLFENNASNLSNLFKNIDKDKLIQDEFAPIQETLLNDNLSFNNIEGRHPPATAIDEENKKLYSLYASTNTNDEFVVSIIDLDNISNPPTEFNIACDATCQTNGGNINTDMQTSNNIFLDIDNNLLYIVVSPWDSSTGWGDINDYYIKIFKVDLSTQSIINVLNIPKLLSENTNQAITQYSADSEIDLDSGFLYVMVSGNLDSNNSYVKEGSNNEPANIVKVKLNAPNQDLELIDRTILARNGLHITSSIIDTVNKYLYVTNGKPTQLYRLDLDVPEEKPPIIISQISLFSSNVNYPNLQVGFQASILDPTSNYAYFASSNNQIIYDMISSQIKFMNSLQNPPYITKVNLNPLEPFEVMSKVNIGNPNAYAMKYYVEILIGGSPVNLYNNIIKVLNIMNELDFNTTIFGNILSQNGIATPSIDTINHYIYFPTIRIVGQSTGAFKIIRYDTTNDTVRGMKEMDNEIIIGQVPITRNPTLNTDMIITSGNIYSNIMNLGYILKIMGKSDKLLTYKSTTNINPIIQSASLSEHNIDTAGYCNYSDTENLNWENIPNDDFIYATSSYFNDRDKTTNIPGLLPDTNESFVPGELKQSNTSISKISLGRSQFTEIEYSLKATNDAKGSYCFRIIDSDPNNDNQTSKYPNMILGYFNPDYQKINLLKEHFYIPITINGIIIDKNELLLQETAYKSTYNIKLASQPTDTVNIHITSDDPRIKFVLPDESKVNFLNINFDGNNWNTNQTISVFVPKTPSNEGTTYGLIHHTSTSNDPSYNFLVIKPIQTIVTDTNEAISKITANICSGASFTPPANFNFPNIKIGNNTPVFSPDIPISIIDERCSGDSFSLTLQASNFCNDIDNLMCIPLNKVYLATSTLVNDYTTTLTPAQIGNFIANYLQTGVDIATINAFKHQDPNDDLTLDQAITLIDTDGVLGDNNHKINEDVDFLMHLLIDYANITTPLGIGTYTTTLTLDFITQ